MFTVKRVINNLNDLSQKQLNILGCTISYAHSLDPNSPLSLTKKDKLVDKNWHISDFVNYLDKLEQRHEKYKNERVFIADIVVQFQMVITVLKFTSMDADFLSNNNCPE